MYKYKCSHRYMIEPKNKRTIDVDGGDGVGCFFANAVTTMPADASVVPLCARGRPRALSAVRDLSPEALGQPVGRPHPARPMGLI